MISEVFSNLDDPVISELSLCSHPAGILQRSRCPVPCLPASGLCRGIVQEPSGSAKLTGLLKKRVPQPQRVTGPPEARSLAAHPVPLRPQRSVSRSAVLTAAGRPALSSSRNKCPGNTA